MIKRKIVFLLLNIVIAILLVDICIADEIVANSHEIEITTSEYNLNVEEIINFQIFQDKNIKLISFWLQDKASDVRIIYKGELIPYNNSTKNYYTINITSFNLNNDTELSFELDYKLIKSSESLFQKELIRNTSLLTVVFDDSKIFTSNNIIQGSSFSLKLYQPKETTLTLYFIIGIILIIILVFVILLYIKKRSRVIKVKKISGASEELLSTKKELLMNLLKDIEKQHRGKEISDDTYHKLKEQYKQETVEAMKQLEDIKLDIK
jgi:hypothetical protein